VPCCNARHGHLICLMNVQLETATSRRRFVNSLRPELSLQHQSTRRSRTAQSCPIRSLVQCGEVRSGQSIAVGTRLTPGPPRRSVRARLSHTAPVLGSDGIAFEGHGMVGIGWRKPFLDKTRHTLPRDAGSLASSFKNGFPDSTQVLAKHL